MPVSSSTSKKNGAPKLERSLNLTLLVLYGLGTTVGAGIYVLIGAAASEAGLFAPFAFVLAAVALAPTAASYAELSGRMPVSAGETAYVNKAFNKRWLSMLTGYLVIITGIVACATIAIGCAGYIRTFIDFPLAYVLIAIILIIGLVASWGILESVLLASLFTIIEVGGLLILIVAGFKSDVVVLNEIPQLLSENINRSIGFGIVNAAMFAVFAFIGFEDMVNVAEETKKPRTALPWAIFLTLGITTLLYFLVTVIAVLTIPPIELGKSEAPLSMVYEELIGYSPALISAIAIFATANTILVQFIMVSRVFYGMAKQNTMPKIIGRINRTTKTPIIATALVTLFTLLLALLFPLEQLAESTSQAILMVWLMVNVSLIAIKIRKEPANKDAFSTPIIVPILGMLSSAALLIFSFVI